MRMLKGTGCFPPLMSIPMMRSKLPAGMPRDLKTRPNAAMLK
jgi:hypothetical protein